MKIQTLSIFFLASLGLLIIAALYSLGFVLEAGRNNNSLFLRALFASWVVSPFAALLLGALAAKRCLIFSGHLFQTLILVVASGSLVSYIATAGTTIFEPAFIFLLVPLVSWLLIFVVFAIMLLKRKKF